MNTLTYSDYSAMGGTSVPLADFDRRYRQEYAYLKANTFGQQEDIESSVFRNCMFDLIELPAPARGVNKETLDEYSVEYNTSNLLAAKRAILNLYLGDTGLLYRGLDLWT